ncbi:MAG: hypothetical protein JSV86_02925 [Gemmatimonadota bacterium]|nr:MAG: hypothetical protein JSV86_02925 [Gemmatimonadota bacterium]
MLRRSLRAAVQVLLVVSVFNLSACNVYVPTGIEDLERPDRVRVYLSVPSEFELLDLTANNVSSVDGEVVRWDDEELVLSVWWLESSYGLEFRGQGETIVVPRQHINHIEERKFSVAKTAGLIGILVVAFAVGVGSLAAAGASGSNGGPPDPPN